MLLFSSVDIVSRVCLHTDKVQQLGLLCQVNRTSRDYLLSPAGGKHWTAVAIKVCGKEHWPPVRANQPHRDDERYVAMLRLCPWLSVPRVIKIAHETISGSHFVAMHVDVDHLILDNPTTGVLVSVPARASEDIIPTLIDLDSDEDFEIPEIHMTSQERDLLGRVKKTLTSSYFQNADPKQVHLVHNGVFMLTLAELGGDYEHVAFFSTGDMRLLRSINHQKSTGNPSVHFKAGEMWFLPERDSAFVYYGPAQDKATIKFRPVSDSAFWALYDGDVVKAVDILEQLGLPLNEKCAFKGYNLLHHAAERADVEAVKFLMGKGIPLNDLNMWNQTAEFLAGGVCQDDVLDESRSNIVSMLQAAGAVVD